MNKKQINQGEVKYVNPYKPGPPIFQFWFEDGVLHMWTTVLGGLFTIDISEDEEMHFLGDVFHKPEVGRVYEFKGIHKKIKSNQTEEK